MFVGIVLFLQTMCCEFHKLFIIKCALYVCMFLCNEIKENRCETVGLLWYVGRENTNAF